MSTLKEQLLSLPEPILVTTHRDPDADGASCVQALLQFLRWHGKEAWTRIEGTLQHKVQWIYEMEEDVPRGPVGQSVEILEDARSLVVCDCQPSEDRLGFRWTGGPVMVIDHHAGEFHLNDPGRGIHVRDVPSSGCVLIEEGIFLPVLYAGLRVDTVNFKFRTLEGMKFLHLLQEGCETSEEGGGETLRQKDIDEMHRKLLGKLPEDFISKFKSLLCEKIDLDFNESNSHSIIVAGTMADPATSHALLEVLCNCANTVALLNRNTGKVSLRTDGVHDINVLRVAERHGGGGHRQAAGCILPVNKDGWYWDFKDEVVSAIEEQLPMEGRPVHRMERWHV